MLPTLQLQLSIHQTNKVDGPALMWHCSNRHESNDTLDKPVVLMPIKVHMIFASAILFTVYFREFLSFQLEFQ